MVELELLAIQWAVQKCRLYLAGTDFEVITDHQPLIGIMNGRNLDAIQNMRIHRLMSKLLGYQFKVRWTPDKTQCIADSLSRSPVFEAEEKADILVCAARLAMGEQEVDSSLPSDPVRDKAFVELMSQAANDSDYQQVYEAVKGHKVPSQLPTTHPAQKFQGQWDALSTEATLPHLILYHGQIVVPHEARKEVLKTLYIQHTGVKNPRQCTSDLLLARNDL